MTVEQLISELGKFPPETLVAIEVSDTEYEPIEVFMRNYFDIVEKVILR